MVYDMFVTSGWDSLFELICVVIARWGLGGFEDLIWVLGITCIWWVGLFFSCVLAICYFRYDFVITLR